MEGGQDSSNLIGGTGEDGHVKKYMFSLENLAWRTSNRPGFTYSDLPICERGPNDGRIMWFPPYDLKFTDTSNANWKSNEFLGRPEPVYTYTNTSRSGTLSWKIVVDHPSVLNMVVNRVLSKETNKQRIDSILESFFAGCRKYDLYELAKKYYTINPNDLYEIQKELIAGETTTTERISYIKKELGEPETIKQSVPTTINVGEDFQKKYGEKKFGVFFENDYPQRNGTTDYKTLYSDYIGHEGTYQQKNSDTYSFFENVVKKQYSFIENELIPDLAKLLEDSNTNGSITITIAGSASAPQTVKYNESLSQRRQTSLKDLIEKDSRISKYVGSKLFVNAPANLGTGENSQVFMYDPKTSGFTNASEPGGCTDGDATPSNKDIYTTKAMACRRAYISNINVQLTQTTTKPVDDPPKDPGYERKVTQDTRTSPPTEVTRTVLKDNITKRVLRQLLSECDYFEVIKEETPMVYDNLRDKLKFFNPAFHSTTPEGLNSRLTFLQQCLRPGDTIPVIKTVDGVDTLDYNNATNSAFGTPPVLVLRVGDFFHTKIIPDSLSLTYENLDINPEGIGVQPMIANVTMNFKFVGGQGLAGAVDKLQNALSFNYYANTEIYDDRADVTDASYKVLDKEFLDFFNVTVPPPTTNQAKNTNNDGQSNNSTIGKILTTENNSSGTTGTISYGDFVDKVVNELQDYFLNVFNKSKEVFKQYNNAVLQNWSSNRNYQKGYLLSIRTLPEVDLFGKPYNIQTKFDSVVKSFKKDIDNDNEGLMKFLKTKNFSSKLIRTLKDNYKNYLDSKVTTIENAISKTTQDFVLLQQNLISDLARINTIGYIGPNNTYGTDGYQQKNGFVQIYYVSGPSLNEYINDVKTLKTKIKEFNDIVTTQYEKGILLYDNNSPGREVDYKDNVFNPFSTTGDLFNDTPTRRSYFILSDDIIDNIKYTNFKNALIGNILSNKTIIGNGNSELEKEFDSYWIGTNSGVDSAKKLFTQENALTETFLNALENKLKDTFFNFKPFNKKERVFNYTTIKDALEQQTVENREELIKSLGLTSNKNNNKDTWNDGKQDDVLFSKIKFN